MLRGLSAFSASLAVWRTAMTPKVALRMPKAPMWPITWYGSSTALWIRSAQRAESPTSTSRGYMS